MKMVKMFTVLGLSVVCLFAWSASSGGREVQAAPKENPQLQQAKWGRGGVSLSGKKQAQADPKESKPTQGKWGRGGIPPSSTSKSTAQADPKENKQPQGKWGRGGVSFKYVENLEEIARELSKN